MAHIDGSGRIILDSRNKEPIDGWAILVHGKTRPDLLFATEEKAHACAVVEKLTTCEIVPIVVTGEYVERT